ncbi:MAG: hypothetical protein Q4D38_12605 [Planctomycetia bacterium]|nr:hypothetical protein [Planctomycetia bacterium]
MVASNRTNLLKRLYVELKKKYKPIAPPTRSVLEHFIFGICLEDATYEAAEEAFNALLYTMSGWNEVRVSSATELAEMMPNLPDPRGAAIRVKKILRAVFEEKYAFDMDDLRKKNIRDAYATLESIPGGTPFAINYVAQTALGRHGIPVGNSEKKILYVLGIIDAKDVEEREVTGLNRAISKAQGAEFTSLLHQLASSFIINPESRKTLSFLKSFAPDFRERLGVRRELRQENPMETPEPEIKAPEITSKNMVEILKNDPDFRREVPEDEIVDEFENLPEEEALEEPLPEKKSQEKKSRGKKPQERKSQESKSQDEVPIEEKPQGKKPSRKKSQEKKPQEKRREESAAQDVVDKGARPKKVVKKTEAQEAKVDPPQSSKGANEAQPSRRSKKTK